MADHTRRQRTRGLRDAVLFGAMDVTFGYLQPGVGRRRDTQADAGRRRGAFADRTATPAPAIPATSDVDAVSTEPQPDRRTKQANSKHTETTSQNNRIGGRYAGPITGSSL